MRDRASSYFEGSLWFKRAGLAAEKVDDASHHHIICDNTVAVLKEYPPLQLSD
jgi:hypothetical protein